jgi:predicted RNA binding protein YcfA (HicA-like mRNA interferase family)
MERQRGSHILLKHIDGRRITVPKHDTLKQGTLRAILDQADISREQFISEL